MNKKIFSIKTLENNHLFTSKLCIILIFLISKFQLIFNEDISTVNAPYPVALQLKDKNIFISNQAGMFFCNENLELLKGHEYYNKTIYNFQNIKDKISIGQFEEGNNIICIIEDVFYFFEENGNLIIMGQLPNEIKATDYLEVLPYKNENNSFHFIVTFMDSSYKNIFMYHYKIYENNYYLISNNIYSPFYFYYPNIQINAKYYTCQIIYSENKGNVLICCFKTFESDLIVFQSFEIEKNLSEIEEYYCKTPIDSLNFLTSTISEDKKTILIFYSPVNTLGYFLTYNFDTNLISNITPLIEKCSNSYSLSKVKYFKETKEYVLICHYQSKFTVIRLGEDFSLKNPDEITTYNFEVSGYYSFNSLSLIYDTIEEKYAIIADSQNYSTPIMTKKFILDINYNQSFASSVDKPTDFVEEVSEQDKTLKEENRYYIYAGNYEITSTSNIKKIVIDFVNETNLFIKTKENKPIDPNLYTFAIKINHEEIVGKLTAEIDGEEKEISELVSRISNITHLNYYPYFHEKGYMFSFTYTLFLKNISIASVSAQVAISVCKENCTCAINNFYCIQCIENYIPYLSSDNCKNPEDLKSIVYENGYYVDCYYLCKTCYKKGYGIEDMGCESCYEGDYMDEKNACHEKECENLFYRDKYTGEKICINDTSCPNEYPIINDNNPKQCIQNKIEDNPTTKATETDQKTNSPSESSLTSFINTLSESISTNKPVESSSSETSSTNKISEFQETEISSLTFSTEKTSEISDIDITSSTEQIEDFEISTLQSTEINQSEKDSEISTLQSTEINQSEKDSEISTLQSTEINQNEKDSEIPTLQSTENNQNEKDSEIPTLQSTENNQNEKDTENNHIDEDFLYEQVMDLIEQQIGKNNIDQINQTYAVLSNYIQNMDPSTFKKDIMITGTNITYQITSSENQKHSDQYVNISIIDLGECEKIIKKNISYEDDPTPLLILKIDVKKKESKTTSVEYEVYNPYNKEIIDLSICENTTIGIFAPVNLNNQETSLYDDLNAQGYDLFDVNNSFFTDPCTPYTSSNGTDVSLLDRKDYYYNEEMVLCEDVCKYINVNTSTKKVFCECKAKTGVNTLNDQEFSPQKLLESFFKIDTFANFEVLFCYKLLFSSRGLKKNICFYIMLVLFILFLVSILINLFTALKKIDGIIFKIFQDRFMYYFMKNIIDKGHKRRNNINGEKNEKAKLNWMQIIKYNKQKNPSDSPVIEGKNLDNKNNLYNMNNNEIKKLKLNKNKSKKKKGKKRMTINDSLIVDPKEINNNSSLQVEKIPKKKKINETFIEDCNTNIDNNNENNINNENEKIVEIHKHKKNLKSQNHDKKDKKVGNININIINNIMNKHNPPVKKKSLMMNVTNYEDKSQAKEDSPGKIPKIPKKQKSRQSKKNKGLNNDLLNSSSISNSASLVNLKKNSYNEKASQFKNSLIKMKDPKAEINKKNLKEKKNKKKKKSQLKPPHDDKKNLKYIDEELNRMDYEEAILYDKRNYWQYYWSLLKKKHMIILTFVSNDDYNVFLLKCSLFILSISLFFAINTLFYRDSTMHNIFSEQGRYNLLYQIPQILYSTMISFVMTLILKKLSLSQNELIKIKNELDQTKSKKLADESKNCLRIKLYSFFFIGLCFFGFFWYYISVFSAVYTNTQIYLIKDTLMSFGISMSYPLIINLFPGLFRLYALKSEKKDKKCWFQTGQIISLI